MEQIELSLRVTDLAHEFHQRAPHAVEALLGEQALRSAQGRDCIPGSTAGALYRGEAQDQVGARLLVDVALSHHEPVLVLAAGADGIQGPLEQVLERGVAARVRQLPQRRHSVIRPPEAVQQQPAEPMRQLASPRRLPLPGEAARQHAAEILEAILVGEEALEHVADPRVAGILFEGRHHGVGGFLEVSERRQRAGELNPDGAALAAGRRLELRPELARELAELARAAVDVEKLVSQPLRGLQLERLAVAVSCRLQRIGVGLPERQVSEALEPASACPGVTRREANQTLQGPALVRRVADLA